MPDREFALPAASDGQVPIVQCWEGTLANRGAMILAHGMGEHALRYESLARSLNGAGFVVYAIDHRGHGKTAGDPSRLGDYGPEGWRGLLDDLIRLIGITRSEQAGPVLVMGHSMGSMLVQHLLAEASELIDGAALSGTTAVDLMASAIEANPDSSASESGSEVNLFSTFNAAFEPVRTEADWLSRDPEQVDLYVEDPLCGFTVSDASMVSLMEAGALFAASEAISRIRKELPILVVAGDMDPVGGNGELVELVAQRYREAGIGDVTLKLYPGARHEIFNETNRQEVEADFGAWASRVRDQIMDGRMRS